MHYSACRLFSLLSLAAVVACAAPTAPAQPTVPPLPTQIPADQLLSRAQRAFADGDEASGREALAALLIVYPAGPISDAARLELAAAQLGAGRPREAATTIEPLAAAADQPLSAAALFLRARALFASGDYRAARADYEVYAALGLPLADYARLGAAAAAEQLGDRSDAEALYLAAGQSDLAYLRRAEALEAAHTLQLAHQDFAAAAATYGELLSFARSPDYRRTLLAARAEHAFAAGDAAGASSAWHELITEHPASAEAAAAFDRLRELKLPLEDPAAAVWAYIAADRAADAVSAAEQLLPTLSGEQAQAVLRLRGLAHRALGNFDAALADLDAARAADPASNQGIQARLDAVQTIGQRGAVLGAAQAYLLFAEELPDDRRAPIALDRAIQLFRRLEDGTAVAQTTVDLARRYPSHELSHAALHRLALEALKRNDLVAAHAYWRQSADSAEGTALARAAYWSGRTARALKRDDANADLALAIKAAPTSYFAARAAELLELPSAPKYPLNDADHDIDWPALQAWVAGFAGDLPADVDAGLLSVAIRAAHLRQVGLEDWAHAEWLEGLRRAEKQPAALLRLAALAGVQSSAPAMIQAADQLAAAVPPTAAAAPADLLRLRYPAPYAELVLRESIAHNLDPRLMLALLRQESQFNPRALSWAGARGLAQVMPETAAAIAADLQVTDFSPDDLFNPALSVRFGSFYLGRRLSDMQGSAAGALAAYNGGLGNAQRWAGGSLVADPDLFLESIDFPETRDYVQRVLAGFHQYQQLYLIR